MLFRSRDQLGWFSTQPNELIVGKDVPDQRVARLAFDKLNEYLINDEAAKVSQGGFHGQESSETPAFGGTWPTKGESSPAPVNPESSRAEIRASYAKSAQQNQIAISDLFAKSGLPKDQFAAQVQSLYDAGQAILMPAESREQQDRKSTRLNSSH